MHPAALLCQSKLAFHSEFGQSTTCHVRLVPCFAKAGHRCDPLIYHKSPEHFLRYIPINTSEIILKKIIFKRNIDNYDT